MEDHKRYYKEALLQGRQGEGAGGRADGQTGVKSQKCTFLVSITCCELRYYNTYRYISINLIKFKRNARLHECTAIIYFRFLTVFQKQENNVRGLRQKHVFIDFLNNGGDKWTDRCEFTAVLHDDDRN